MAAATLNAARRGATAPATLTQLAAEFNGLNGDWSEKSVTAVMSDPFTTCYYEGRGEG